MDIAGYIQQMPKAEIGLTLEGAVRKQTWLMLAEENEVASENRKAFTAIKNLLDKPEASRIDELYQGLCSWIRYPDDLTRLVYDVGVSLAKQNIRYAEIAINPALFMLHGMSFDDMMSALNDGRDRAERGWKILLRWNLVVARSEPRRADDIVRWATSVTGRKHGIVGYGLIGKEDVQPIGQFERSFQNAAKKDLPTFVRAGETLGGEGVFEALTNLHPKRVIDGLGVAEHEEAVQYLIEHDVPVVSTLSRSNYLHLTRTEDASAITEMMAKGLGIILSVDMPELYQTNLTAEYQFVMRNAGLSVEKLNEMALNALQYAFVDDDTKRNLLAEFEQAYQALEAEFLQKEV